MDSITSRLERIVFARLHEDEDILQCIEKAARTHSVDSGFFIAIGTTKKAVFGFYDDGRYLPIEKTGRLEILSCTGNVSMKESDELVVHGHIVLGDKEGNAFGGHVLPGCVVDATAELVLVVAESGKLSRRLDIKRNLFLLSLKE